MKGTLQGGKPLGAPRGPFYSCSQLDTVCCGMGLAKGCWSCWSCCAGAMRLPQPRTLQAGHARTAMGSPKPQSQGLGILPEDLGQGSAGDWGFTAHTQR